MAAAKEISRQVSGLVESGSTLIDLRETPQDDLRLTGKIDLSEKVLVLRAGQFIEFANGVNLAGSVVFLNGGDAAGLDSAKHCHIVRGLYPSGMLEFGIDGELKFSAKNSRLVTGAFQKAHQELFVTRHEHQLEIINPLQCKPDDLERLFAECWLIETNPGLPFENIGSSIAGYNPKNKSQEKAKAAAQKLLGLEDPGRPAGLFLEGVPGVGKTHLSVALATEFMIKGLPVHFISADKDDTPWQKLKSHAPSAWVLDDLNSPYGNGMSVFKQLIIHVHTFGGRLLVTSNTSSSNLMEHGFTTDREQRPRILDRFNAMMLSVKLEGNSNRTARHWSDE